MAKYTFLLPLRVPFGVYRRPSGLVDLNAVDKVALFDGKENIFAGNDAAKDTVLTIEPGGSDMGDEKLAAVGVGAGIGHAQHTRAIMFEVGVKFVAEAIARAATTGTGRIAALDHEVLDDAVEGNAVVKTFTGEKDKIVDGKWHLVSIKAYGHVAFAGFDSSSVCFRRVDL